MVTVQLPCMPRAAHAWVHAPCRCPQHRPHHLARAPRARDARYRVLARRHAIAVCCPSIARCVPGSVHRVIEPVRPSRIAGPGRLGHPVRKDGSHEGHHLRIRTRGRLGGTAPAHAPGRPLANVRRDRGGRPSVRRPCRPCGRAHPGRRLRGSGRRSGGSAGTVRAASAARCGALRSGHARRRGPFGPAGGGVRRRAGLGRRPRLVDAAVDGTPGGTGARRGTGRMGRTLGLGDGGARPRRLPSRTGGAAAAGRRRCRGARPHGAAAGRTGRRALPGRGGADRSGGRSHPRSGVGADGGQCDRNGPLPARFRTGRPFPGAGCRGGHRGRCLLRLGRLRRASGAGAHPRGDPGGAVCGVLVGVVGGQWSPVAVGPDPQ